MAKITGLLLTVCLLGTLLTGCTKPEEVVTGPPAPQSTPPISDAEVKTFMGQLRSMPESSRGAFVQRNRGIAMRILGSSDQQTVAEFKKLASIPNH